PTQGRSIGTYGCPNDFVHVHYRPSCAPTRSVRVVSLLVRHRPPGSTNTQNRTCAPNTQDAPHTTDTQDTATTTNAQDAPRTANTQDTEGTENTQNAHKAELTVAAGEAVRRNIYSAFFYPFACSNRYQSFHKTAPYYLLVTAYAILLFRVNTPYSGDSPEVRRRSFAALRMTAWACVILSAAKDLRRAFV